MILEQIKGKLVVSCQALPHEPLHSSYIMSRMAVAAMECRAAQETGFDIVSTTMSGYTDYSPRLEGPDFNLIRRCAEELSVPVIAEGKIHYPEDLKKAFECGAFSAVVGGAITRPQEITARFVKILG